jgi:hypothetical protein
MAAAEGSRTPRRSRFLGSPTIRVNGRDVEPDAERRTDFGMKCRLYRGAGGVTGQPAEEWVRAAIAGRRASTKSCAATPTRSSADGARRRCR